MADGQQSRKPSSCRSPLKKKRHPYGSRFSSLIVKPNLHSFLQYFFTQLLVLGNFEFRFRQRHSEDILNSRGVVDLDAIDLIGRQVFVYLLLAFRWHNDVANACAFGGEELLLIPPTGSTLPLSVI